MYSQRAEPVLQAADADDRRARRAARRSTSRRHTTSRPTSTTCSSRRARSGGDDWTTLPDVNGAHLQRHRDQLHRTAGPRTSTRSSTTTRRSTPTGRARRRATSARRRASGTPPPAARRAGRPGRSTSPPTPGRPGRGLDHAGQRPGRPGDQRVRRRHPGLDRRGHDLVRGRRRSARRLDRPGLARGLEHQPERLGASPARSGSRRARWSPPTTASSSASGSRE